MKELEIKENLFDLTEKQIKFSKEFYGKVIKLLIAPFHSYETLKEVITHSDNLYLFPERDLSLIETRNFLNTIVDNKDIEEALIVSANQNIIQDFIKDNVRILTEFNEIKESPIKTFLANLYDIDYEITRNKDLQSEKKESLAHKKINEIIQHLNNSNKITTEEFDIMEYKVRMIGDELTHNHILTQLKMSKGEILG